MTEVSRHKSNKEPRVTWISAGMGDAGSRWPHHRWPYLPDFRAWILFCRKWGATDLLTQRSSMCFSMCLRESIRWWMYGKRKRLDQENQVQTPNQGRGLNGNIWLLQSSSHKACPYFHYRKQSSHWFYQKRDLEKGGSLKKKSLCTS